MIARPELAERVNAGLAHSPVTLILGGVSGQGRLPDG